ncbi:MAG: Gfo/Idh/MocA family protein [Thermoguttaceae bacterium]
MLKAGAAAGAAAITLPALIPARALGRDGAAPASETVRVGIIGCGGRSRDALSAGSYTKAYHVVSVCDCQIARAQGLSKERSKGQWPVYDDFRKMIDKEKLDAVMIETTTHARAWIVIQAMQAGVDTYIEKPMCLTIAEGRAMVNAARKFKTVTQVGTQQRSIPLNNFASDLVKNGAIGKILTVVAPNFVGPEFWTKSSSADVKGAVDPWWDIWTNQAELRPFCEDIHSGWARWIDYDGGGQCFGVTGWGAHSYDQINRALGTDATGPVEVVLEEKLANRDSGRFAPRKTVGGQILGDTGDVDTGTQYHAMAKLTGPRAKVTMKFANGTQLSLHLDGDRGPGLGAIFVGERGKIEINRDKVASNPKELLKDKPATLGGRHDTAFHVQNWIECIKSRNPCNADIEIGLRATTLCYLVNIVRQVGRVGEVLRWDPVAERFTNCDEANKLLTRPRRKGYELPAIG